MRLVSNNSLVTTVLLVPGVADHVLLLLLGVRIGGARSERDLLAADARQLLVGRDK